MGGGADSKKLLICLEGDPYRTDGWIGKGVSQNCKALLAETDVAVIKTNVLQQTITSFFDKVA